MTTDRERLIGELRERISCSDILDTNDLFARAAAMLEADAPTADDHAVAEKISLKFCMFPDGRVVYGPVWAEELRDAIAAALAAARRAGATKGGA